MESKYLQATLCALMMGGTAGNALAQEPETATPARLWSGDITVGTYFLPGDDWFLQPTAVVDRGRLHLESRYNYEDRDSLSFFAGANFEFGDSVKLALTPMFGGLVGLTDAVVPALELDLTWGILEFYAEAEYLIDAHDHSDNLFYNWSELSIWPTEWLRGGMVTQRVRVRDTDREVQRGIFAGVAFSKLNGTFYVFKPGSDERYALLSLGVTF
jgi:hypothetical protein